MDRRLNATAVRASHVSTLRILPRLGLIRLTVPDNFAGRGGEGSGMKERAEPEGREGGAKEEMRERQRAAAQEDTARLCGTLYAVVANCKPLLRKSLLSLSVPAASLKPSRVYRSVSFLTLHIMLNSESNVLSLSTYTV